MDPMTIGLLAGAGAGLLKGLLGKKQEARDRVLAAETARWSPWTGMQPTMPQRADVMGDVISAGTTGLLLGQNYSKSLPEPNIGTADPTGQTLQIPGQSPYVQMGPAWRPGVSFNSPYGG